MSDEEYTSTKSERREAKQQKRRKMRVSGRSVFGIQDIQAKRGATARLLLDNGRDE